MSTKMTADKKQETGTTTIKKLGKTKKAPRFISKEVDLSILTTKRFIAPVHTFPHDPNPFNFNQWLGGLLDGDGHLCLTKKKYPQCTVETHVNETDNLRTLQATFSGSVCRVYRKKTRALGNRWTLNGRHRLTRLLHAVNGHIHHPVRYAQFVKCCSIFGITPEQLPPTVTSSLIGRFFRFWRPYQYRLKESSRATAYYAKRARAPLHDCKSLGRLCLRRKGNTKGPMRE